MKRTVQVDRRARNAILHSFLESANRRLNILRVVILLLPNMGIVTTWIKILKSRTMSITVNNISLILEYQPQGKSRCRGTFQQILGNLGRIICKLSIARKESLANSWIKMGGWVILIRLLAKKGASQPDNSIALKDLRKLGRANLGS